MKVHLVSGPLPIAIVVGASGMMERRRDGGICESYAGDEVHACPDGVVDMQRYARGVHHNAHSAYTVHLVLLDIF